MGCCDRVVPELDSGHTLQTECHARATGARGFIFRFEHKLYRWRILPARPPACTPAGDDPRPKAHERVETRLPPAARGRRAGNPPHVVTMTSTQCPLESGSLPAPTVSMPFDQNIV